MSVNSLTAYALGSELHRKLAGSTIKKATSFFCGLTVILDGAPFAYWHILYHGREPELFPWTEEIASPRNSIDALKIIWGSKIAAVRVLNLDRIFIFELEPSSTWGEKVKQFLRIALTPAGKPAALFHGGAGRAVETIGPLRAQKPSSRDEVPPQKLYSILSLPASPPEELTADTSPDRRVEGIPGHTRKWDRVRRTADLLLQSIGGLDPVLARALSQSREGNIGDIWPLLIEIRQKLHQGRWSWSLYNLPGEGGLGSLYPFRLPLNISPIELRSPFEALTKMGIEKILPSYMAYLKHAATSAAQRGLRKALRLRRNISMDLKEAERAKEYRHYGNLLATYRHLLKTGMEKISVRDFSGDRTVTIPMDPSSNPERNIRSYFVKAKKGEKGILIIRNRIRMVAQDIETKRKVIEEIEGTEVPDGLLPLIPTEKVQSFARAKIKEPPRFRSFKLDDRHTIFVGRNDEENDLLTHRFSTPGDLWFHAQEIPGSHVVLKGATQSTPKKLIEKTAAVAAFYSKARHSTVVPVIYTEKRYVRKPRKAKRGTAVCLRGKTIFVKPSLPGDENPNE